MAGEITSKRPASLSTLCRFSFVAIALTILYFIKMDQQDAYTGALKSKWNMIMIAVQLPILAGVLWMYLLKKSGLWIFLAGKVLFFALPALAGVDVMGLMTPIFFFESAVFFILFGKQIRHMN